MIGFESIPRFAETIRRHLGTEEIVPPGFILRNDPFELRYQAGIEEWSFQTSIAANVGNVSHIECFNPPTPAGQQPLIVVVTAVKVHNAPAAAQEYLLTIDGAAGGAPQNNVPRDLRNPGVSSQNRILNTTVGTSGVHIDALMIATAGADGDFKSLPVLLTPTHRLCVFCVAQNQGLNVIMSGYEYLGRAEEIAP